MTIPLCTHGLPLHSLWQSDIDEIYVDYFICRSFEDEKLGRVLTVSSVGAKLTIFLNPSSLDA